MACTVERKKKKQKKERVFGGSGPRESQRLEWKSRPFDGQSKCDIDLTTGTHLHLPTVRSHVASWGGCRLQPRQGPRHSTAVCTILGPTCSTCRSNSGCSVMSCCPYKMLDTVVSGVKWVFSYHVSIVPAESVPCRRRFFSRLERRCRFFCSCCRSWKGWWCVYVWEHRDGQKPRYVGDLSEISDKAVPFLEGSIGQVMTSAWGHADELQLVQDEDSPVIDIDIYSHWQNTENFLIPESWQS